MKIYPSLISSDILNLEKTITTLDDHCDGYHLDVMDFHFVPNLTWGPQFVNAIAQKTNKPLHVHLMVDNPAQWISVLSLRSNDVFIIHYEAIKNLKYIQVFLKTIKDKKWKVGIAINPQTDVTFLFPFLSTLDTVLVMSVNPGFSGQKFIPDTLKKIEPLIAQRKAKHSTFTIGMDGGVNESNIKQITDAGIDYIGVAAAIFEKTNAVNALNGLYKLSSMK